MIKKLSDIHIRLNKYEVSPKFDPNVIISTSIGKYLKDITIDDIKKLDTNNHATLIQEIVKGRRIDLLTYCRKHGINSIADVDKYS